MAGCAAAGAGKGAARSRGAARGAIQGAASEESERPRGAPLNPAPPLLLRGRSRTQSTAQGLSSLPAAWRGGRTGSAPGRLPGGCPGVGNVPRWPAGAGEEGSRDNAAQTFLHGSGGRKHLSLRLAESPEETSGRPEGTGPSLRWRARAGWPGALEVPSGRASRQRSSGRRETSGLGVCFPAPLSDRDLRARPAHVLAAEEKARVWPSPLGAAARGQAQGAWRRRGGARTLRPGLPGDWTGHSWHFLPRGCRPWAAAPSAEATDCRARRRPEPRACGHATGQVERAVADTSLRKTEWARLAGNWLSGRGTELWSPRTPVGAPLAPPSLSLRRQPG